MNLHLRCALVVLSCLLARCTEAQVKIFILAGQSNMAGPASMTHLRQLAKNDAGFKFLMNGVGSLRTRSDVRIVYNRVNESKAVPLQASYGSLNNATFGPDYSFGWAVGDAYLENVLLIKCAVGGSSLGIDWQSPSGVGRDYENPNFGPERYGRMWRAMVAMVDKVKANVTRYVPGAIKGYELAGVVWFQGWNDVFNVQMNADYEANLQGFIVDLMDNFGETIPIIIGELGQQGLTNRRPPVETIRQTQERVAGQFGSNVKFVPTSPYVVSDGEQFGGLHHYYGRADTFLRIGFAFAYEMIALVADRSKAPTLAPMVQSKGRTSIPTSSAANSAPVQAPVCFDQGYFCSVPTECCTNRCRLVDSSGQRVCIPIRTKTRSGV